MRKKELSNLFGILLGGVFFIWPKRNIYKKNLQFDFSSLRSISCINEYVFTLK